MQSTARTWRNDNRFGERYSSLVSRTQSNISLRKFIKSRLNEADKLESRKAYKNKLIEKFRKLGKDAVADSLARCCSEFYEYRCPSEDGGCGIVWGYYPKFTCNYSFCPDCAAEKGIDRMTTRFSKILTAIDRDATLKIMFTTFTRVTKPGRTMKDGSDEIKEAVKTLRRRQVWKRNVVGGYVDTETTKTNGWHTHIHATLLVSGDISDHELSAHWQGITGGSWHVETIEIPKTCGDLISILKYPFKAADISNASLTEIEEVLEMKGEKLHYPFGIMYGGDVDEKAVANQIDPYAVFVAKTKKLREGDDCPNCGTQIIRGRVSRDELVAHLKSAKIPKIKGQPHCRGN